MAGLSDIEWTDATWNPVSGCVMVSPGCTNCYAMRMASRLQAMKHPAYIGLTRKSGGRPIWTGRVRLNYSSLYSPLKWKKPRLVFVNSMSDLFQDAVPIDFIVKVWSVMEEAKWHIFQILTKRPERMSRILSEVEIPILPNVWLGTSVESEEFVGRLDFLRKTPAAVRFVSFEPLLDSVGDVDLNNINWAIVGGESGPKARPVANEWVDEIKAACDKGRTTFFFKQWGGRNKKAAGRTYQGRTWDDLPMPVLTAAE